MTDSNWNPSQYQKYHSHRLRPAIELLQRIPLDSPDIIYDLGCGTGEVTRMIARRWQSATVIGLDNSREMLAKAQTDSNLIHWQAKDIRTWIPDQAPDLIYSNAVLHWLDDHRSLFKGLAGLINRGGCLAVQMPLSWDLPSHQLIRETLDNCDDSGQLGTEALRDSIARKWVEDADVYYDLLSDHATSIDIWETEYLQVLEGEDPVFEWVKATALLPILNSLNNNERQLFIETYKRRLRDAYPIRANGQTLYPFRRLFIVALF